MYDLVLQLIKNYGIIGVFLYIGYNLIKLKPVTLITSSDIELKLLTKEKRFFHKVLNYIIDVFSLSFIFTIITSFFLNNNIYYRKDIATIVGIFIIICTAILIYFNVKRIYIIKEVNERAKIKKYKIIVIIIYFLYLIACLFLPAYFIGTQLQTMLSIEEINNEKLSILISLFVLNFVILIFLFRVIKEILTGGFYYKEYKNIYILLDEEKEKWYVFHPIDNKYFYLGNKPQSNESTEFRFITREELIKLPLRIESNYD